VLEHSTELGTQPGSSPADTMGMEIRHLSEHRMRIERRRGALIITGVTLFALAARLLMF